MFYILHGKEELGQSEELASMRAKLADGDPAMAQLNTTVLEGKNLTLGTLRHACDTIPFMSDRRLVIVHGLLSWLAQGKGAGTQKGQQPASRRSFLDELTAYLPTLPPTTRLVFEDLTLAPSHPVLKLAQEKRQEGPGLLSSNSNSPRNGSYRTGFSNGLKTRVGRSAGCLHTNGKLSGN